MLTKGVVYRRRILRERFFSTSYHFLMQFPLTRDYTEKIAYRYQMISPCDRKFIMKKTVTTCFLSWSISLLVFILVYATNPRVSNLITAGVAIIIMNAEVIGRMAKIFEISTLFELQELMSNMIHNFYIECRVDDALYRSMGSQSKNMKTTQEQIYQLLLCEDKEEALREYYSNVPNRYLRAFVGQCVSVMELGNQIIDGNYLFVRNLENLQREIEIELDKLQRLRMEFLGVIACVIAPIFCIDIVKQFSISLKENMDTFYYGKKGFLLDMSLLFIITLIYFIMQKSAEYKRFHQSEHRLLFLIDRFFLVKKAMDNFCEKNTSKMERLKNELRMNGSNIRPRHFVLCSFLIAFSVFLIGLGGSSYLHAISKDQLLYIQITDAEVLTSVAKENQYEKMCETIERYVNKYVIETSKRDETDITDEVKAQLELEGEFRNSILIEAIATEINRRVSEYHKEHFSILDLVSCFLLSWIGYHFPELILRYHRAVSKDAMEDEVNQFHAIISMLMYVESMTVKQILEQLEAFAVVFKPSLRICINNYGTSDIKALEELKDHEPYEPLKRIVDNLIRCDDIPIEQAFHEINIERDGYISKRKLANEKSIRKRVVRAYFLAAVPFALLLAYSIIPTMLSTINEINSILEELNNSSW